jgi:2-polyprenyl-3-methyl-5-hydroxy-6-metoxy-1,4-benzoquinol methylase
MSQETVSRALHAREHAKIADHDYALYHSKRYDYVVTKCLAQKPSPDTTVLDIGRSPLTLKLCQHYRRVTSLGFPLTPDQREAEIALKTIDPCMLGHIEFDLNEARTVARYGSDDKFELIVFGETIEHLVAPPELVLSFLKGFLTNDGIIICQTPNAVALHKRLKMLLGINPYERLRFEILNQGHIREYTKQELIEIGQTAGLCVIEHEFLDYFGVQGGSIRHMAVAASKVASLVFPSLSRGQTIIYCLPATDSK